jgi:hypothetical protein
VRPRHPRHRPAGCERFFNDSPLFFFRSLSH